MKGKKEGGEKNGKEGRKKGKGERRGKKKEKEREREKIQSSTAGLEPATFHSDANCLWLPPGSRIVTIHVYIANFDFDDLTVAVLAPPITRAPTTYLHSM